MEIIYCSKCGKMIPPGGVDEGKRYLVEGETVCPKCYRQLPPAVRSGNAMVVSENLTLRPASKEPAEPDYSPKAHTSKLSMPAAKRRASTRKLPAMSRSSESSRLTAVQPAGRAILWWVAAAALVLGCVAVLALHRDDGREGSGRGPGVRPPPDNVGNTPAVQGPDRSGNAHFRIKLESARSYWSENPDDYDGAIRRFQQLETPTVNAHMAQLIDESIRSVEIDREVTAQAVLEPLQKQAGVLAAAGDFDGAAKLFAEPPEKLAGVLGPRFDAERRRLAKEAEEKLSAARDAAEKLAKEGRPENALAELDKVAGVKYAAWAAQLAALRERLEKEKSDVRATAERKLRAEAEQVLAALLEGIDRAALAGDFAAARTLLTEEKAKLSTEQVAFIAKDLAPLERLTEGLVAAEARRKAELGKLVGQEQELAVREGKPLKGKLQEVQEGGLRLAVSHRQGDAEIIQPRMVAFKELAPGELHRLAPGPEPKDADGRLAAAVFAMGSGFGAPGKGDLDRAGKDLAAAGEGPLAARWSGHLEKLKLEIREDSARRDWREGLAALAGDDRSDIDRRLLLPKFLDGFARDHAASDFAKARQADIARLRDAAGGGEGAARLLFKARVAKYDPKTREIELVWDFSATEQLADFAPVKDKVKVAGGSCVLEPGATLVCQAVFRQPIRASAPWKLKDGGNFGLRLTCGSDSICFYWDSGQTRLWRAGRAIGFPQSKPAAEVSVAANSLEVIADKKRILGPLPAKWTDVKVSLYSVKANVSYDSLRVAGVLERAWLEAALAKSLAAEIQRATAAAAEGIPAPAPGPGNDKGTGLAGEYFAGQNFEKSVLKRTDPEVNFIWGVGSPGVGMPVDGFSVRWTGFVRAPQSGEYTFRAETDDGVRLWIDGRPVIDDWEGNRERSSTGKAVLTAGRLHELKLEYYEFNGPARARLLWIPPSAKEAAVIGKENLFPLDTAGAPRPPER